MNTLREAINVLKNEQPVGSIARTNDILTALKSKSPNESINNLHFSERTDAAISVSPWFYPDQSGIFTKLSSCVADFNKQHSDKAKHITKGTISQWLAGLTLPKGRILEFIADKLEVNGDWLVGVSDVVCNQEAEEDVTQLLDNEEYINTIGGRLLLLITENKLNRKAFASIAGVSRSTAYKFFTNQGTPSGEVLIALAEHFNVSTDWILLGEKPSKALEQAQAINQTTIAEVLSPAKLKELIINNADLKSILPEFEMAIQGDTMFNPQHSYHIPSGAVLKVSTYYDPDALRGSVIVIAINQSSNDLQLEVGAYSSFGGGNYLNPLNKQYSPYQMKETDLIVGIVTGYSFKFL